MKTRSLVLIFLAFLLVVACSTISKDAMYLVNNLDDANKAIALTNQGVAAYDSNLVQNADYSKADKVREYFLVALRFDPSNARAKQYLDKIDNYRSTLVAEKLKTVDRLVAKPTRKDDDNYTLILALQTVTSVDPANAEATKLLKDNASVRTGLMDSYLQKSKDSQAKAAAAATDSARDALYYESYDYALKASTIAQGNAAIQKQKDALIVELGKVFDRHQASQAKLVTAGKFDNAKAELDLMGTANEKLGHARDSALATAAYGLYFQWAKALVAKNSLQEADQKLGLAISAKPSDEATALKNKISGQAATLNQDAAFDAALPQIDSLIAKGDLVGASKQIAAAAKMSKDSGRLALLDPRRAKIAAAMSDVYNKGVAAYRAENFKLAIEQLTIVVKIDSGYEQAADYLSKATEKQKLLDQYSN